MSLWVDLSPHFDLFNIEVLIIFFYFCRRLMMPSSSSRDCNSSYHDDASSRKNDDDSFNVDGESDYEDEICVDDDDIRPPSMVLPGMVDVTSPPAQSTPQTSPLSSPVFPGQPQPPMIPGMYYTDKY